MNQVTINIDQWQLFLPLIVLGVVLGWQRGWREMAIFVVAMIFATMVASAIEPMVPTVLARLVNIGRQLGPALTDTSGNTNPPEVNTTPPGFLEDPNNVPLIMLILFFVLSLAAYAIAKAIGTRGNLGLFGRLGGAAFGGVAFVIILYSLLNYWVRYQAAKGNTTADTYTTATPQIVVPSVQLNVAGLPVSNFLATWYPWAIAVFVILILVYALSRVSRASA